MTEEESVNRVIAHLRKREPEADWNVNDVWRAANILTVVRIVLALNKEEEP